MPLTSPAGCSSSAPSPTFDSAPTAPELWLTPTSLVRSPSLPTSDPAECRMPSRPSPRPRPGGQCSPLIHSGVTTSDQNRPPPPHRPQCSAPDHPGDGQAGLGTQPHSSGDFSGRGSPWHITEVQRVFVERAVSTEATRWTAPHCAEMSCVHKTMTPALAGPGPLRSKEREVPPSWSGPQGLQEGVLLGGGRGGTLSSRLSCCQESVFLSPFPR